ncbi:hypothetical protein [Massilia sp. CFBP9026]|uniref:hypothetical protein n=1 Tax=Massilia sp. CFBP9026 TaxID=3096536 RepID=UPI002A6ACAAC|nr:hypothetical protein [Massilia sp. CFBP9026]MDY0962661.1 hypothetical protein [Massilia sp. CFBP9026]
MTQPLMTLTARFDVNQIDDGIDWLFSDIDSGINSDRSSAEEQWNRDVPFSAGQEFRIAITASDKDLTGFESLEVIDCCLITRPHILSCGPGQRTHYAPPSLFASSSSSELGALYRIEPSAFTAHGAGVGPNKGRQITLLWDGKLKVGPYNGIWELSFYLTVRIKRAGDQPEQLRVFYFDPETEVGNGTYPPG